MRTPDYGALQEENRKLGRTGQGVVVDLERERLEGRPKLAKKVKNVAADLGDGAGYDVLSFNADGSPLRIEVKTTRGGESTPFYLSAWELEYAEKHPESARLYRVYDLGPHPEGLRRRAAVRVGTDSRTRHLPGPTMSASEERAHLQAIAAFLPAFEAPGCRSGPGLLRDPYRMGRPRSASSR